MIKDGKRVSIRNKVNLNFFTKSFGITTGKPFWMLKGEIRRGHTSPSFLGSYETYLHI